MLLFCVSLASKGDDCDFMRENGVADIFRGEEGFGVNRERRSWMSHASSRGKTSLESMKRVESNWSDVCVTHFN